MSALFVAAGSAPARAWEEETHKVFSNSIVKYLPDKYRKIASAEKDTYMVGATDGKEIYDETQDENGGYNSGKFGARGMEMLMREVKELTDLERRNAPASQMAYQMGRLNRLLQDYLEPLPGADSDFSPLETAGTRVFFIEDYRESPGKFSFVFDGYTELQSLPAAVESTLNICRGHGKTVYSAYRKAKAFSAAEEPADRAAGAALNLTVDIYYTLSRSKQYKKLDMDKFLGLKRFRGGGKTDEQGIKKPNAPKPPGPPSAPEPEDDKKSGK